MKLVNRFMKQFTNQSPIGIDNDADEIAKLKNTIAELRLDHELELREKENGIKKIKKRKQSERYPIGGKGQ